MRRLLLIVFIGMTLSRCSIVFDDHNHDGLYFFDYCPKFRHCLDGTHVMCTSFNPDKKWGPFCKEPFDNVSVTPEIAIDLVNLINGIRSKVALGEELGKHQAVLPKAYGMNRLKWDHELATFAQITANQCLLQHDLCRATHKFSSPGQTAGRVRFTHPHWASIKGEDFATTGLTSEKINYAVSSIVGVWYKRRKYVDVDMIGNAPDYSKQNYSGRPYLEMIYGAATHMGCGIAAFTEVAHFKNTSLFIYNTITIYCNFSERPKVGELFYNVTSSATSSPHCGCPPETVEDNDCLCNYNSDTIHRCEMVDKGTSSSQVILPIFSYKTTASEMVSTARNAYHPLLEKKRLRNKDLQDSTNYLHSKEESSDWLENNKMAKKKPFHELHNKKLVEAFFGDSENERNPHEKSVFSKKPRYSRKKESLDKVINKSRLIKADVIPRRDFSQIKQIVEQYFQNKKKSKTNFNRRVNSNKVIEKLNKKQKPRDMNLQNNDSVINEERFVSKKRDKDQIMTLVDALEYELNHAELDVAKKKILDEKLSKIYSNVVGNVNTIQASNNLIRSQYEMYNDALNKDNQENFDLERSLRYLVNPALYENIDEKNNKHLYDRHEYLLPVNNKKKPIAKKEDDLFAVNKALIRKLKQRNANLNDKTYPEAIDDKRRLFFQEKLDTIQRKLNAIEKSEDNFIKTHSKNSENDKMSANSEFDPVYVPDRAKIAIGY